MKKLLTLLIVFFVFTFGWSQNNGINYKAKISNNQGNTLVNQNVTLKFSILSGVSGTNLVYQEQHTTTTNANGIVITNIGEGQLLDGVFESIDWGNDNHFLKTEIDTGSGYIEIGFTEFKTVPYALYALSSGSSNNSDLFYQSTNGTIISNVINQDFIIGSSSTEDENDSTKDVRLFFDKSKAAFRAGRAEENQWNDTNRGLYSFASGNNNIAKGLASNAFGQNNTVLGSFASAFGQYNIIPTEGATSFVTGVGNKASSNYQFLTGFYNDIDPNVLFAVGNGTDDNNRLSVFTVDKNGVAASNASTINIDNATNGALITKKYLSENKGLSFVRNEDDTYGWRILNSQYSASNNFGTLGLEAVDLSIQNDFAPDNSGATGIGSLATGFNTTASGNNSAAFNSTTLASHSFSSAFGFGTRTGRPNAMVLGSYNSGNQNAYFEIGNGFGDTNRSNAFMVELNGRATSSVSNANIESGLGSTLITKDYLNSKLDKISVLQIITENNKTGYQLVNINEANHGDIGIGAVDFTQQPNDFWATGGGATGDRSFAVGLDNLAKGFGAAVTGTNNLALGDDSFATGARTEAIGFRSFSSGFRTSASGLNSTATGDNSIARGDNSFASGSGTKAMGFASFSSGALTVADHDYSSAFGEYTTTARSSAMVIGQYNQPDSNALFEIGNGYSGGSRNTAFKVHANGDVYVDNLSGSGDANIKVNSLGKLTREEITPKTSYYSISYVDFKPISSSIPYDYFNGEAKLADGASQSMLGAVNLPHGSTIKNITYYYKDTRVDSYLTIKLRKILLSDSTASSSENSINTSLNQTSSIESNLNILIDNSTYSYIITIEPSQWWDTGLAIQGVKIEYTE